MSLKDSWITQSVLLLATCQLPLPLSKLACTLGRSLGNSLIHQQLSVVSCPATVLHTPRHYINKFLKRILKSLTNKTFCWNRMTCTYPPLYGEELTPKKLPNVSGYVQEEILLRRTHLDISRESLWAARAGQESWDTTFPGMLAKLTITG